MGMYISDYLMKDLIRAEDIIYILYTSGKINYIIVASGLTGSLI